MFQDALVFGQPAIGCEDLFGEQDEIGGLVLGLGLDAGVGLGQVFTGADAAAVA